MHLLNEYLREKVFGQCLCVFIYISIVKWAKWAACQNKEDITRPDAYNPMQFDESSDTSRCQKP